MLRGISAAMRGLDAALPGGDGPLYDAMSIDESEIPRLAGLVEAAAAERKSMDKRGM